MEKEYIQNILYSGFINNYKFELKDVLYIAEYNKNFIFCLNYQNKIIIFNNINIELYGNLQTIKY